MCGLIEISMSKTRLVKTSDLTHPLAISCIRVELAPLISSLFNNTVDGSSRKKTQSSPGVIVGRFTDLGLHFRVAALLIILVVFLSLIARERATDFITTFLACDENTAE
jgi:hypothetical protein